MRTRNNQLATRNPFEMDFFTEPFFGLAPMSIGFPKPIADAFTKMTCDVKETDEGYVVEAEFPGAAKNDIDISFDEDVLTISYEKSSEDKEEKDDGTYLVRERSFSSYKRSFRLPNADAEATSAKLEDGILTIELPKKAEEETRTTIAIG